MEILHKLAKTAEGLAKQLAPNVEYKENEENFHIERKKYFSAPKI
jgi:hypothetical protein